MDDLQWTEDNEGARFEGTCHGEAIEGTIAKSVVIPRVHAFATGRAFACYLGTYLGCDAGEWLAFEPDWKRYEPRVKAFTRSKVTIVAQTADRIVANVTEAAYFDNGDHVARVLQDKKPPRLFTDAEVEAAKDSSRYTIIREKDGVWRISDRKTSYGWFCDFLNKRPH